MDDKPIRLALATLADVAKGLTFEQIGLKRGSSRRAVYLLPRRFWSVDEIRRVRPPVIEELLGTGHDNRAAIATPHF